MVGEERFINGFSRQGGLESRQGRYIVAQRENRGPRHAPFLRAPGWWKRWVPDAPTMEPRRGGTTLAEQFSRIVFNSMPPQNGAKFVLEAEFAMVLPLILDVTNHRAEIRCADAERAVSLLP
jgi:hypothetical protein